MRIAFKSSGSARLDASASSRSAPAGLLAVGFMLPMSLAGLAAFADEPRDAVRDAEAVEVAEPVALDNSSSLISLDGVDTALSESDLTEQRAMAKIEIDKITVTETDQDGVVAGNVAVGDTGHNTIADHAFEGASGMIMSVQNTGSNVLIQNSTTINVSVEQ